MSDDLVKRLAEGRTVGTALRWTVTDIHREAAAALVAKDAEIARLRAEYITDDKILEWIVCMGDWDAGGAAAIDEMYDILEVRAALNTQHKEETP